MFRPPIIKAVIFDMDGLMIDTESIAMKAFDMAMKDYDFTYSPELFISLIGCDLRDSKKILKAQFGEKFPFIDICHKMGDYEKEHIRQYGIKLKKGIIDLLQYLDEKGIPKGVGTSTRLKPALEKLKITGLKSYFSDIVGGDQVEKGKPAPDIFIAVAQKLGIAPNNCVVLEDSEPGLKAAHAAGMIPIMIPDIKKPSSDLSKIVYKVLPDHFHVITELDKLI